MVRPGDLGTLITRKGAPVRAALYDAGPQTGDKVNGFINEGEVVTVLAIVKFERLDRDWNGAWVMSPRMEVGWVRAALLKKAQKRG